MIGLALSSWRADAAISVVENPTGFWKGNTFTLTVNSAGSGDFGGNTCLVPKAWFYTTVTSQGFIPIWPDEVIDPLSDPKGPAITTSNTFTFTNVPRTIVTQLELYSYTPSVTCAAPVSKLNETWTYFTPADQSYAGDYYLWFSSIDAPSGSSSSTGTSTDSLVRVVIENDLTRNTFYLFAVLFATMISVLWYLNLRSKGGE